MKKFLKNTCLGAFFSLGAAFLIVLIFGNITGLGLLLISLIVAPLGQYLFNQVQLRNGHYKNTANDNKEVMYAAFGIIPALIIGLSFIWLGISLYIIIPALLFLIIGLLIHFK